MLDNWPFETSFAGSHVHSFWFACPFSQGNFSRLFVCHTLVIKCIIFLIGLQIFCRSGRRVATILLSGSVILPKLALMRLGARDWKCFWDFRCLKMGGDWNICTSIFLRIWMVALTYNFSFHSSYHFFL